MIDIQAFPSSSTAKCCQALGARVTELEHRLLQETQRRENEYNQLLRFFISNRKEINKEQQEPTHRKRQPSKGSRTQTAPSARKEALKVALNRRASHKHRQPIDLTYQNKPVNINMTYKITTPHVTPELTTQGEPISNNLLERITNVEGEISKQLQETQKMKELNDYLMDQLLTVFQKIKLWEEKGVQSKGIVSEETVTSVVMDQEVNEGLKLKLNNNCSSSRLSQSGFSKTDLGEIAAKVAQHQSVLSQLIQLTKGLTIGLGSDLKSSSELLVPHHP